MPTARRAVDACEQGLEDPVGIESELLGGFESEGCGAGVVVVRVRGERNARARERDDGRGPGRSGTCTEAPRTVRAPGHHSLACARNSRIDGPVIVMRSPGACSIAASVRRLVGGVPQQHVAGDPLVLGEHDLDLGFVRMHDEEDAIEFLELGRRRREVLQCALLGRVPVVDGHRGALGVEPVHLRRARRRLAEATEAHGAERRVLAAEPDEAPRGREQVGARARAGRRIPGQPGHLGIVAVRVVVASLAAAELVARGEHRHTRREQQGAEEVPDAPPPRCADQRVGRVALDAVVEGVVAVGAVTVQLAVAEVVLHVVGGEVGEREAVVGGDEVEARERTALDGRTCSTTLRVGSRSDRCRCPPCPSGARVAGRRARSRACGRDSDRSTR